MISKKKRLVLRLVPEFFLRFRKSQTEHFQIFWTPIQTPQSIGNIVVSKKIAPLSTKRNLLKRRLRNLLSERISETRGIQVVVIAKKNILKNNYAQLNKELFQGFGNLSN